MFKELFEKTSKAQPKLTEGTAVYKGDRSGKSFDDFTYDKEYEYQETPDYENSGEIIVTNDKGEEIRHPGIDFDFLDEKKLQEMKKKAIAAIKDAAEARAIAQEWQKWQSEESLSYGEVAEWQQYFEAIAKKFGLEEEFKENGII